MKFPISSPFSSSHPPLSLLPSSLWNKYQISKRFFNVKVILICVLIGITLVTFIGIHNKLSLSLLVDNNNNNIINPNHESISHPSIPFKISPLLSPSSPSSLSLASFLALPLSSSSIYISQLSPSQSSEWCEIIQRNSSCPSHASPYLSPNELMGFHTNPNANPLSSSPSSLLLCIKCLLTDFPSHIRIEGFPDHTLSSHFSQLSQSSSSSSSHSSLVSLFSPPPSYPSHPLPSTLFSPPSSSPSLLHSYGFNSSSLAQIEKDRLIRRDIEVSRAKEKILSSLFLGLSEEEKKKKFDEIEYDKRELDYLSISDDDIVYHKYYYSQFVKIFHREDIDHCVVNLESRHGRWGNIIYQYLFGILFSINYNCQMFIKSTSLSEYSLYYPLFPSYPHPKDWEEKVQEIDQNHKMTNKKMRGRRDPNPNALTPADPDYSFAHFPSTTYPSRYRVYHRANLTTPSLYHYPPLSPAFPPSSLITLNGYFQLPHSIFLPYLPLLYESIKPTPSISSTYHSLYYHFLLSLPSHHFLVGMHIRHGDFVRQGEDGGFKDNPFKRIPWKWYEQWIQNTLLDSGVKDKDNNHEKMNKVYTAYLYQVIEILQHMNSKGGIQSFNPNYYYQMYYTLSILVSHITESKREGEEMKHNENGNGEESPFRSPFITSFIFSPSLTSLLPLHPHLYIATDNPIRVIQHIEKKYSGRVSISTAYDLTREMRREEERKRRKIRIETETETDEEEKENPNDETNDNSNIRSNPTRKRRSKLQSNSSPKTPPALSPSRSLLSSSSPFSPSLPLPPFTEYTEKVPWLTTFLPQFDWFMLGRPYLVCISHSSFSFSAVLFHAFPHRVRMWRPDREERAMVEFRVWDHQYKYNEFKGIEMGAFEEEEEGVQKN